MSAQPRTATRRRRERGSINPDAIVAGAFELAERVSVENLSMPLLAKHLGVGVTSIYWYFRKKDDLLNAMTDHAARHYDFSAPFVEAGNWRESLRAHAIGVRRVFVRNATLTDLILIRGALSPTLRAMAVQSMERAIESLIDAGLSPEDAYDTYSTVSLHLHGSVVLHRLAQKTRELYDGTQSGRPSLIDAQTTPVIAELSARGHRLARADDNNFEYGLDCILDHTEQLINRSRRAQPGGSPLSAAPAHTGGATETGIAR